MKSNFELKTNFLYLTRLEGARHEVNVGFFTILQHSFLEAVEKHVDVYEKMNLDAFNNAISSPGLTMINLFNTMPRGDLFTTPSKSNSDIVDVIKDNLVGGPSIIFQRHVVVEVKIREYRFKDDAKCDWLRRQQSLLVLFIFGNAHRVSYSTKGTRQFLPGKNIFHQSSRDGMARIRNVEKRHQHQTSALFACSSGWIRSRDANRFSISR